MIILAAVLITLAIGATIVTSHEIERLKKEVTRLENARNEALHNLQEAQTQKKTAEGSRDLLDKIRNETEEKIKGRQKEIEELKTQARPEREVKLGDPANSSAPARTTANWPGLRRHTQSNILKKIAIPKRGAHHAEKSRDPVLFFLRLYQNSRQFGGEFTHRTQTGHCAMRHHTVRWRAV